MARVRLAPMPDGWNHRAVIINDGSADGTMGILEKEEWACVINHTVNQGKGAALLTGFDSVLKSYEENDDYIPEDVVVIQDADLEYDPADYPELLEPIITNESKVVFGTRFGAHREFKRKRERIHAWGNGMLTHLSNFFTGHRVSDMECCYKLCKMEVAVKLRPMLSERGFGIEPQIAAVLARLGEKIAEVPIHYSPRRFEEGKKIKWSDAVWAAWVMLRERLISTFGKKYQ